MIEYKIVPIERWPEGWNRLRPPARRSPFSASWSSTLELLDRELTHLRARQITIQVDLTRDDFRLDGNLRTAARINYPGVIVGFDTKDFGGLSYPCNAFDGKAGAGWKENVRAIALGLEALRRVERYGIANRGQQYAGFAELGSGIALSSMTHERALEILLEAADTRDDGEGDWDFSVLFRTAASKHHPDKGGDSDYFKLLVEARDFLEVS
jgi:hypothetical protein